ncbi:hypothetical protein [Micromonospora profundi]|uniref:hypothetical protein n=1 Tax=Micromonospora profundi TaxID=1420889 RepID=UPI00364BEC3A
MTDQPYTAAGWQPPDRLETPAGLFAGERGRRPAPECLASMSVVHADCDGCTCSCHREATARDVDGEPADATAAYNAEALTARWTAVYSPHVDSWALSINGREPGDGGRMAADLVMTRELAEHIADVHNQWLARRNMGVPVATGFIPVGPEPGPALPWAFALTSLLVMIAVGGLVFLAVT